MEKINTNNRDIFISYQWNIKPDVIRLEENLLKLNHTVNS